MVGKASHKQKPVPLRTCVACRQRYEKRRLTRIVNTREDGVVIDLTGKRNGRGAYLCDQLNCWDRAINDAQLLNQALKAEVTPEERAAIAEYRSRRVKTDQGT